MSDDKAMPPPPSEWAAGYDRRREIRIALRRKRVAENPEKVLAYRKQWNEANKERSAALAKYHRHLLKVEVLRHYSGGEPKCLCCGETNLGFLTLDHLDGDGVQHRRKIMEGVGLFRMMGGTRFYRWLKKNGFPSEPRLGTGCMNCNAGRQWNGGVCPHVDGGIPPKVEAKRKRSLPKIPWPDSSANLDSSASSGQGRGIPPPSAGPR